MVILLESDDLVEIYDMTVTSDASILYIVVVAAVVLVQIVY